MVLTRFAYPREIGPVGRLLSDFDCDKSLGIYHFSLNIYTAFAYTHRYEKVEQGIAVTDKR